MKPITIVYTSNGKTAKRSYNWLLGHEADWAMDVRPFIIQDPNIADKVEGLFYKEQPVSEALIRKYPQHGLQFYFGNKTQEKEEILENNEVDLEDLATKGISEIKMVADEAGFDIEAFIEIEKANKNRKTLIDYLNGIK